MNELLELPFEHAVAELALIVKQLEEGPVGLEDSLALYEKGVALVRRCQNQLGQVEQRILAILGQDEAGNPVTGPFHHTASAK